MFIRVADEGKQNEETIEIPVDGDADGSVSLSTLTAQFQGVSALKYRNSESGVWRGVRVVDGKLYHPDGEWDPNAIYVPVYSKPMPSEIKRKGFDENQDETMSTSLGQIKPQRIATDFMINNNVDYDDIDRNRRCVDLIVLGISYRSLEDDVKKCFEEFGELVLCEIKRDSNGQSRGFGFIRYKNYESQLAVINKRHFIDGRHVDVKIPESKASHEPEYTRKIFITHMPDAITTDDLRQYFSKYGTLTDIYIPKPARSFGFVTFTDSSIVRSLLGKHVIKGCTVTVGLAEPKTKSYNINDYPSSTFKKAKSDHRGLRTFAPYAAPPPAAYPYYHQQFEQASNTDRMFTYFQQYNVSTPSATKEAFPTHQQSYWNTTEAAADGIWQ
ncbi:unnamed protein product [Adineta steineri]|uniref:RRM domain-containing protein n=1 Tax=Adineta steineri TaxID=433720 RepID=A0A815PJU3_9BILA|nr:unnamed protein product [Adineta steineri]